MFLICRYLNTKKIKNEENVMHVHVCPFSNASMTDSDTNSVFSNTSSNTSDDYQADNSNTRNEKKQMPKVLTETDDVYKEMNNDKLFSMIVKYHTNKRCSALLQRRAQQSDLLYYYLYV